MQKRNHPGAQPPVLRTTPFKSKVAMRPPSTAGNRLRKLLTTAVRPFRAAERLQVEAATILKPLRERIFLRTVQSHSHLITEV